MKSGLVVLAFLTLPHLVYSQETDHTKQDLDVDGSISITNDGISTIPSLSLGEPAAIFDLSIGKRFHFDPTFRYSLEGEPWSFVFRFRYDLVDTDKFFFRVALNPFLSFKTLPAVIDEVSRDAIEARRGGGLELFSSYELGKNVDIGTYSIHGHGFDDGIPDYSNYISVYSLIEDIPLFSETLLNIRPQFFYLNIDKVDGFYVASNFEFAWGDFPLTISSIINRTIETDIKGNPDLLWNVSLNYSFEF